MTTPPATSAWIAPATTFSIATHSIAIGASRRSSISRVNWKSAIIGNATACRPESSMLIAMMPGSSRLL